MSTKRAVVVLGVGSDGTSLFAGLLHRLGFYVGEDKDLIPTNKQNPKGFYEHRGLPDINRVLLKEHRIGEYEPSNLIEDSNYACDVAAFFEQTFENHNRVVLKDPRFCVTLPVWAAVIEKTHSLNLLVVQRSLEDHIDAIRRGGRKDELEARDYVNNRRALQAELSKRFASTFVELENFVNAPETATRWLIKELKTRCSKKQMEDIVQFIED